MPNSQSTQRLAAVCEGCGKGYRVPSSDRAYKCAACGGKVRAEPAVPPANDPAPSAEREATCPACSALNPAGAGFCEECGAKLASHRTPVHERRAAAAEFHRIARSIRVLRWIYGTLAVSTSLVALFLLKAVLELGVAGAAPEQRNAFLLVLAITSASALLLIAGTIQVARHPFAWGVGIAAWQSLCVVAALLSGKFPVLHVVLAVILWCLLVPTARLSRLLREHPDLYSARHFTGRTAVGRAGDSHPFRLVAMVAGGLAVAAALFFWLNRPPALEPVAARFADAWNAGGPPSAEAFFHPGKRADVHANLARLATDYGWIPSPPRISAAGVIEPHARPELRHGSFDLGGEELATVWQLSGGAWHLHELAPPLDGLPERLRAAWNRGDIPAIASFAKDPERVETLLTRTATKRGWSEGFPTLDEGRPQARGTGRIDVAHRVGSGVLLVHWRLDDGRWSPAIDLSGVP